MINFLRGGLKEGFVKTSAYGPAVTAAAKQQADAIKAQMLAGQFVIFKGPSNPDRHRAGKHELSGRRCAWPDLRSVHEFIHTSAPSCQRAVAGAAYAAGGVFLVRTVRAVS
ncbi:bmp family protein, partial [Pseudomonas syringae pv. actinidiae ICMP 18804]